MKKSYHAPFILGQAAALPKQLPAIAGVHTVNNPDARVIDPVRFSRAGSQTTGALPLAELERLEDLLSDREGTVSYAVEGYTSTKGQPALRIRLTGDLALRCQRCLERLPLHLDVQRQVVLVTEAADLDPLEDEEDNTDTILSTGSLDLRDLLEQEIVLSVPMVPRHPEGACSVQAGTTRMDETASSLAALAQMKARRK